MQMRGFLPTVLVAAFALLSATREAVAQVHRYGAGWTVGAAYVTDLNSHPLAGSTVDPRPISPGLGYTLGVHFEQWFGRSGRLGVRYQGFYERPKVDWAGGTRGIDAVSGDLSMLYRVLSPAGGGAVLPYLTVGAGGIWYDLERGQWPAYPAADAYNDGNSRVLPMAAFGLGVDTRPVGMWDNSRVRVRFEAADHMVLRSPLRRSDWQRHGSVHHLRFTVGMYSAIP